MILGIDPGKSGGIALLDEDGPTVTTWPMPDTTWALHELIAGLPIIRIAAVEKPFVIQAQGVSNALTMGINYGILIGALSWRDIPFREVRPADWKPAMGVPKDKTTAREIASRMFPDAAGQWRLAKEDGRAEAALIAVYAQRWRAAA